MEKGYMILEHYQRNTFLARPPYKMVERNRMKEDSQFITGLQQVFLPGTSLA